MADRYVFNPLTGKMDIAGEGGGGGGEEKVADFEANVLTPALQSGDKIEGKTAMEILKMMFCPDKSPSVKLSSSLSTKDVYLVGSEQLPTFSAIPTKSTNDLDYIILTIYNKNNVVVGKSNKITNIESGKSYDFDFEVSMLDNTKVVCEVYDVRGKKGSSTLQYTFGYRKYFGWDEEKKKIDSIDKVMLDSFSTKPISTTRVTGLTDYTLTKPSGAYFYIAMPTIWGLTIDKISNRNGFIGFMEEVGITELDGIAYSVFVTEQLQVKTIGLQIK